MDMLYQILIAPIEALMRIVLSAIYGATGSYGVSIFLLSMLINVVLLPLFQLAERWQEAERKIQKILKPKLQEFRQVFSGEERHAMIHTLYRQAGYHPIYAMRSSFGLFLQLPFWIAAYQLLSQYQPLNGASFLVFEDLGKPDRLLMGLNLLPFIMTALNLAAGFVYTKSLSRTEQIQPLVLASLFLVLLYSSPAGLLLYWTFNSLFSLLRIALLNRTKEMKMWRMEPAITAWVLTVACAGTMALSAIWIVIHVWEIFVPVGQVSIGGAIMASLFLTLSVALFGTIRGTVRLESPLERFEQAALIVSSVVLSAIMFLFNPLFMFASSPDSFGSLSVDTVGWMIVRACLVGAVLYGAHFVIGRYFSRKVSLIYLTGVVWAAFVAFSYGYLLTVNYGLLREDKFTDASLLFSYARLAAVPEPLGLSLLFYGLYRLVRSNPVVVVVFFSVASFALTMNLIAELKDLIVISLDEPVESRLAEPFAMNASQPSRDDGLSQLGNFRFSKTGTNIVLLVPDAGAGYVFSKLVRERPFLRQWMDGFTFYPNAISSGPFTLASTAALIGGPDFTPHAIRTNDTHTIEQLIANAYNSLINHLHRNSYGVQVINPSTVSCADLSLGEHDQCFSFTDPKVKRAFLRQFGIQPLTLSKGEEKLLNVLSLFKSSPLSLKPLLYNSRQWTEAFDAAAATGRASYMGLAHSYLQSLPALSHADGNHSESQFLHLWTADLISPFFLDESCNFTLWPEMGPSSSREEKNAVRREFASMCYLIGLNEWFEWMKREGVYDNTKIIIASDHGAGFNWYEGAVNPLMMVKDFSARGELKISKQLMYNADTLSIICSSLQRCESVGTDPTLHPHGKRELIYSLTRHGNPEYAKNNRRFEISKEYSFNEESVKSPQWRQVITEPNASDMWK